MHILTFLCKLPQLIAYATQPLQNRNDFSLYKRLEMWYDGKNAAETGKAAAQKGAVSMQKNYVITITRQFGSLGRDIGKAVARMLQLPLYDRTILEQEAEALDSTMHSLVEFSKKDIINYYKMAYPLGIGSSLKQDRMFELQSQLVLQHAEQESCVIIGRCADYLLRERDNVIRCYIFAPYQARIRNSIRTLGGAAAEPQRIIEEVDKARAEYYHSHTGCEVNNTRYRDLFLNSNLLGVEGSARLIVDAAVQKFGLELPADAKAPALQP